MTTTNTMSGGRAPLRMTSAVVLLGLLVVLIRAFIVAAGPEPESAAEVEERPGQAGPGVAELAGASGAAVERVEVRETVAGELVGSGVAAEAAQEPAGDSTTYTWRLVDAFGTPLGGIMAKGRWDGPDGEQIQAAQVFVAATGDRSELLVSWSEAAPVEVTLETGAPGYRPLVRRLPAPIVGGRTELGDLEVPTVAEDYDEPLVTGRVLDTSGRTTAGLEAFGWAVRGIEQNFGEAWRTAGGGVVLVDPLSGEFEMFGPPGVASRLGINFQAPNRIGVVLDDVEPGTRDLVITMQPAQLVRMRFDLPETEETWGLDLEFWSDRRLSESQGYPGLHDLMRPADANELRLVCPVSGFVLQRFILPPSDGEMLDLGSADLRESVELFEITLEDAEGGALTGVSILLERPDGERVLLGARYYLEFLAPRDAGVLRVGALEDGELVGEFQSLDLAQPAESLSFP